MVSQSEEAAISKAIGSQQNTSSKEASERMRRRGVAHAINELRRRERWSQADLAQEIHRYGHLTRLAAPDRRTVSRWGSGESLPSPHVQSILGKIAAAHGEEDLAELLSAPLSGWRLVLATVECGFLTDSEKKLEAPGNSA
jgi:DNA-binding transcriptional regulator YiaG